MTSKLLLTPLEIRLGIYQLLLPNQLHVRLQANALLLSKCLASHRLGEDDSAQSFDVNGPDTLLTHPPLVACDDALTRVWAPRLGSAWGPHWRCEEKALGRDPQSKLSINLLLVCKQIYYETIRFLMRTATVHISDLEAIRRCSGSQFIPCTRPNISLALLRHATYLSISLRLPLEFYSALEQSKNVATLPPHVLPIADSWSALGSNLSQLPNLVRLTFWLDHDKPCSWAVLSERAIFSSLAVLFLRENLEICVSLPKLHPKYENTDRHFTDRAAAPFILYRRYRQRYHQG